MAEDLDAVTTYAGALGLSICSKTVLVEGTTDADLLLLAARLEQKSTGVDLLGQQLTFAAAGQGESGGTYGVIREFVALRAMARICLLPNGRPRYRFIALFDNDKAGRHAITAMRDIDKSVIEYRNVFRLWPSMPTSVNLDPVALKVSFSKQNASFGNIDWEIEDALSGDLHNAFVEQFPDCVRRIFEVNGKIHREFTPDGKARLHRFVKQNAIARDLCGVIDIIRALRVYLGLR